MLTIASSSSSSENAWSRTPPMTSSPLAAVEFSSVALVSCSSSSSSESCSTKQQPRGKLTISKDNQLKWRPTSTTEDDDEEEAAIFHAKDISSKQQQQHDGNNNNNGGGGGLVVSFVSLSQRFELHFASVEDANCAFARISQPVVVRVHRKSLSFGDEDEEDAEEEEDDMLSGNRNNDEDDLFSQQPAAVRSLGVPLPPPLSKTTHLTTTAAHVLLDENTKPLDYRVAARMLASKHTSAAARELAAKHLYASANNYVFIPLQQQAPLPRRCFSSQEEQAAWEKQEFAKLVPKMRAMKAEDDKDKARVERECGVKITRGPSATGQVYRYVDSSTGSEVSAKEFAARYAANILLVKPAPPPAVVAVVVAVGAALPAATVVVVTKETAPAPPAAANVPEEGYEQAVQREMAKLHAKFDQALAEFNAAKQLLQRQYSISA